MDLNQKPVVPAADFLNDSDSKTSFEVVRNFLMEQSLWDEVSAAAALKFNIDLSKLDDEGLAKFEKNERVKFTKLLEGKDGQEALEKLQDLAINAAIVKADRWERLAKRTKMSVAYMALKRQTQRRVEDYSTFEQFLFDKLDLDPSEKSAQEAVFMLEFIQSFESRSGKDAADAIFSSEIKYGKMIAGLPEIREKYLNVVHLERQRDEHVEELNKEVGKLRREKSNAISRSEPEEKIAEIETKIKETTGKIAKIAENTAPEIQKANVDFQATAMAAAQLAKDPSVKREDVASKLPKVAAEKIEQMGHNPAEVSAKYERFDTKPIAFSIHNDVEVVVMIRVPKFSWKVINSALKVFCDVRLSTFDEGMKILKSHMNPNKKEVAGAAD